MPSWRKRVSNRAERAGDAHVAAEGHVHAGADGGAVHRRQGGQRAAGDPQEALVDGAQARPFGLGQVAEVGAGAERRRRPGHHHRTDAVVGLDALHGGHDLLHHRGGEGVALGRVVQGEGGDAVGDVDQDEGHGPAVCHGPTVDPMAAASVRPQIERLLDEEPGRTMAVIVQAGDDDRAVTGAASAVARSVAERRLADGPAAAGELERAAAPPPEPPGRAGRVRRRPGSGRAPVGGDRRPAPAARHRRRAPGDGAGRREPGGQPGHAPAGGPQRGRPADARRAGGAARRAWRGGRRPPQPPPRRAPHSWSSTSCRRRPPRRGPARGVSSASVPWRRGAPTVRGARA